MKIPSEKTLGTFYDIDVARRICSCHDFFFRRKPHYPCKHIKKWLDNNKDYI